MFGNKKKAKAKAEKKDKAKPATKPVEKPKPKTAKEPSTPAPTGGSDNDAVCASCGVLFEQQNPKPGAKCAACSKKK